MENSISNTENVSTASLNFVSVTAQTFAALVVSCALSLIVSVITARMLGPAGRGALAVIILYPTLLVSLGHLSIHRALTVYIAEKKYQFSDFPGSVIIFVAMVSLSLISGFVIAFFNFNKYFIQGVNFYLILLALSIIPCAMLVQIFVSLLQARKRMIEFNLITVVLPVITLIFMVVTLLILKRGVTAAVFSYFISNFITSLLVIYFVKKNYPGKWRFNPLLLRQLVADGIKLHAGVIGAFIFSKIGIFILAYYREPDSVGYYAIASSMADLFILVPTAIQHVFYSKIPDMMNDKADMARKTIMVYKHALLISLFVLLLLAVTAKPVIAIIYGREFLPAVVPFLILLPGTWYLYQNNILAYYLIGDRRFLVISAVSIFGSAINLIFNFIFIPRYGTTGVALASLGTYAVVGSAYLLTFLYIAGWRFKDFAKNLIINKEDIIFYKMLLTKFNRNL